MKISNKGLYNMRPLFLSICLFFVFINELNASNLDLRYTNSFENSLKCFDMSRNLKENQQFIRDIDMQRIRFIHLFLKKNRDFYLKK